MAICKFYQQGNCKFGSSCRFEHPGAGNNRNQPQNRFGALASGAGGGGGGPLQDAFDRYNIAVDTIEKDLTSEAPQWILSAYAPGRNAPEQLFGGYPREQSFEEMRLHYMMGKAAGNEQQTLNQAQELYQNAQQQMQNAARNAQDAARFIVEAENKHPNRLDICREGSQGAPFGEFAVGKRPVGMAQPAQANPFSTGSSTTSPFGGGSTQPTPSAFGQPAALGQRPNPFGTQTFGQPAQPSSGFGQPSQPASGFGQQSSSQPQASPFGQPSQPSQPSAPAFGQPSQPTSAFGQASALGAKPSPFGAPAFGQSAQPANSQPSAFGQVGQMGSQPNPFASGGAANKSSSPFGSVGTANNNTQPPAAANPFASTNTNQNNATPNPFGSNTSNQAGNAAQSNPFGQQPAQSQSPFDQAAKPNPFASTTSAESQPASNPFAQNTQNQTNGAFGTNASSPFNQGASQQQNPFASSNQPQQSAAPATGGGNPYPPDSTKQHPSLESYASKNMDGSLAAFRGKPVTYKEGKPGIRAFDGTWTRIWFPGGAPGYYKDTELPTDAYDEQSKNQWASFAQTGTFVNGIMPDLPPPRECTRWDF